MLSSVSLAAFTCVVGAVLAFRLVFSHIRSPTFGIPGPLLGRFTSAWYLWQMKRGDFHRTNLDLHKKYGPVVRVAPNYYSISDPSVMKPIYKHGTKFEKSQWYDAWTVSPDPDQTNLFSERASKRHAASRKKVASMYSMSSLVAYEPFVDNCTEIFKERLLEFAAEGRYVDMAHWLQCYAFDVIGEITFGNRFGFLEAGRDIGGVMESIDMSLSISSYFGLYVGFYPLFLRVGRYLGLDRSYVNEFSSRHIREAKAAMENPDQDLPSHMTMKLVHAQAKDPHAITDWDILMTAGSNVGAGSDTTAISLSSILYHLCRYPHCLEKLRAEVETAQIGANATFKQAQAMPYLQAILKEALRLHPGTGFPLFRAVPAGGQVLAGRFFPEGVGTTFAMFWTRDTANQIIQANVGVNSWVLHYDQSIYGNDASTFRPERWLEAGPEQLSVMEHNYMPFGVGSRTCIGKNISLLEMSKLVPVLVRDFDFELCQDIGQREWMTKDRWFVKPMNFQVKVMKRVHE